jgi:sulfur carrier protein
MGKIKVFINGKETEIDEKSNIYDVLEMLNIQNPMVVVEVNLSVVPKEDYEAYSLQNEDKIEVVSFFGGG